MRRITIILTIALSSQLVYGWGANGHRVIGEVAQQYLTEKAQQGIQELLNGPTLAEVSNWMDNIKSNDTYDSLYSWHYTTIPDGKTYDQVTPNAEGDVIQGIRHTLDQLSNPTVAKEEKRKNLMILVHLVGDLHQPLHVGNGEDRGGNDVRVKWFGKSTNLHRVWDSDMIDSKQLSYTELSQFVTNVNQQDKAKYELGDIVDWAHECVGMRSAIYELPEDRKLGYTYRYEHWDTMKRQLYKGGVRLAYLLNELFA